jgi:HAE1 family hydrophobic/amphiphilic exporter-1/multidrug efflux pump
LDLQLFLDRGANYLDISKSFYEQYEALKKDLPKDIKLNIALDNTIFVKKSVLEVAETLGISILLVILIIYLSLEIGQSLLGH